MSSDRVEIYDGQNQTTSPTLLAANYETGTGPVSAAQFRNSKGLCSLGFEFFQRALPAAEVIAGVEQSPPDPLITTAAATTVGAKMNQPGRETEQHPIEPRSPPSEIVILQPVAMAAILNTVLFQG